MRKNAEVEQARNLMAEATAWSVMKWLVEKKKVRRTADRANATLDQLNEAVKATWSDELKNAYHELRTQGARPAQSRSQLQAKPPSPATDADIRLLVKRVKEADDEAYQARMDAERTFDEAEQQLSTSLAREGCRKAIHSWDLHEKAIRRAEDLLATIKPSI